jgi:hypothetical protein
MSECYVLNAFGVEKQVSSYVKTLQGSMKAILLLIFLLVSVGPVSADLLYIWTDENGVTQSSTTKPAWWKEQKAWHQVGTTAISQPEKPQTKKTEVVVKQPKSNEEDDSDKPAAANRPAAFVLPPYVCRLNQLAEAKNKAQSTNAPIIFLYTDEFTSCSFATAATQP